MPAAVSITTRRMEIPTYVLGPDSPYPVLHLRWEHGFYPYSQRLDIRTEKRPVSHRVVVLENEYVRATVLPDMGGRLFSLYDKAAGQETFMVPPSIKYQNISMRGAWIAGGIEFNFGHRGHNVTTVSPVTWKTTREPDGSASIWVGAVIRPLESRWAVKISLRPGRSALDLEILTMAPLVLPGLMYWWTNAAVEVGEHSKFYYYGNYAGDWMPHSWPLLDGADFSWYRNRTFGADMFLMEPQRDYLGFYDFARRHGLAQTADRFLAPGQKYFTWGADERGRYWDLLLSDSGQTYVEIQRGRLPTQGRTEPVPPMSCDTWSETWIPIHKTDGFSGTANDLVIAVDPDGADAAVVRLLSAVPRESLRVEAFGCEASLGAWKVDRLVPGEPTTRRLVLPDGEAVRRVKVFDAAGELLMDWHVFDFKDEDWTKHKKPFDETKASLEELFEDAQRRRFDWWPYWLDEAIKRYEKILAQDPGHSGSLQALAEIDLLAGRFEQAEQRLRAALQRRPADAGLQTLLGWTLIYRDRPGEAAEPFANAARYETGRRDGLVGLTSAYVKAGRFAEALRTAEGLLAERPVDRWARLFAVMALRKNGRNEQAVERINALLEQDPLWCRATAEAFLLGVPAQLADGGRRIADDSVTAALPYLELGQWADARALLEIDESDEGFSPALRLSHLAYALHKLGDVAGAQAALAQVRQSSLEQANPWAVGSIPVLTELAAAYPNEPMLHAMLGNLRASRKCHDEALAAWRRAAELGLEHTIVYRNLAALEGNQDRKAEALKHYRRAWQLSGLSLNLFTEFDRFLASQGLHAERLAMYEQLPAEARDRSMVALRRVPQLLDVERYDDALEELAIRTFLAGESHERMVRKHFQEALLGKAVEWISRGQWREAGEVLQQGLTYPRNHNAGRQAWGPDEAMVHYMLGLVAEALGEQDQARRCWLAAAQENHGNGELSQAYEMLAWLALDNRPRTMGLAHRFEAYARGEEQPDDYFYWFNSPNLLNLDHGLGQLAKGRPAEALRMWREVLAAEPDARWFRPHVNMPMALLERMCRKVTGPAPASEAADRCAPCQLALDVSRGSGARPERVPRRA